MIISSHVSLVRMSAGGSQGYSVSFRGISSPRMYVSYYFLLFLPVASLDKEKRSFSFIIFGVKFPFFMCLIQRSSLVPPSFSNLSLVALLVSLVSP